MRGRGEEGRGAVGGSSDLEQAVHVEVADVVGAAHGTVVVRRVLVVATGVIVGLVDAGEAGDAGAAEAHDAGGAHVEDVGRRPAAVVELVEVVGGLVIPADCSTARRHAVRCTRSAEWGRGGGGSLAAAVARFRQWRWF